MCKLAPCNKNCEFENTDVIMCHANRLAKSYRDLMKSLPVIEKYFDDYVCTGFTEEEKTMQRQPDK